MDTKIVRKRDPLYTDLWDHATNFDMALKLSFGLGGFGQDLVYAIVSTYLMKYMTDVQLVDPMFVAVLSIFCMVLYKRGYRLTDEFYHHVCFHQGSVPLFGIIINAQKHGTGLQCDPHR